jgi:hypothetical protein
MFSKYGLNKFDWKHRYRTTALDGYPYYYVDTSSRSRKVERDRECYVPKSVEVCPLLGHTLAIPLRDQTDHQVEPLVYTGQYLHLSFTRGSLALGKSRGKQF